MTVSNEQIQATLTAHENRFVVHEAAIAHQDALTAEIRQNLAQASQVLAELAAGQARVNAEQAEIRRQSDINQEQIANLTASITELRNTVAEMVRSQGGTPSS
jgi:peptidoglycan hydrolase CwlO-like protein